MGRESRELKVITPEEIKNIAPLSEVYQMNKYDKYLVIIEQSNLVGGYEVAHERAKQVAASLLKLELKFVIMIMPPNGMEGIKFFNFKEDKL